MANYAQACDRLLALPDPDMGEMRDRSLLHFDATRYPSCPLGPRSPRRAQKELVLAPADAITQTAKETHSAIVVMGAVSRSGLKRLFVGNTAERVLDLLPCDVLIVKPGHFANRVPRGRRGARIVTALSPSMPL